MTIAEKRKAIIEYCKTKNWCTVEQEYPCPLYGYSDDCVNSSDKIIERNFQLVSAMPDYTGEKEVTNEVTNNVDHPSHYNQGGMECIDEMIMVFGKLATMHFCLCNAWKYRYRAMSKNGQEDLDKANWYLAKYKELSNHNVEVNR